MNIINERMDKKKKMSDKKRLRNAKIMPLLFIAI